MDDAGAMRLLQGLGDLHAVPEQKRHRQRPAGNPVGERLSFQILHHQVFRAVLAADVVNGADVGMRQPGDGPGLALEASPPGGGRHHVRQHLDGHGAPQPGVGGPVDLAHATHSEERTDLIRA